MSPSVRSIRLVPAFAIVRGMKNASSNVTGGESEYLLDFSDSGDGWPSIDDGLQQQPSHA